MNEHTNAETGEGRSPESPARRTPYELVFGTDEFEARVFPGIRAEAAEQQVEPLHVERFNFLTVASDAVRAVLPSSAPPEALEQYRALLFHAFNFWRYGKRVYVLEPALARFLVEAAPEMAGWDFEMPHPSLYLQLPANLFWGSISPDSTPEPIDGFFLTCAPAQDGFGRPFQRLEVLVVLGIRRDRAGFSVIPFETEVGPGIAAAWAEAPGRDAGADFQSVLPGGEMAGLYSVTTSTEVLKLLGRALWYVDTRPADVELERAVERRAEERTGSPPLPRLPYYRVSLGAGAAEG